MADTRYRKIESVNIGKGYENFQGSNNEERNPGRPQIGPPAMMGYYSGWDMWEFCLVDKLIDFLAEKWEENKPDDLPERPSIDDIIKDDRYDELVEKLSEYFPNLENLIQFRNLDEAEKEQAIEDFKQQVKDNVKQELWDELKDRFPALERLETIPDYFPNTELGPWNYTFWRGFDIPYGDYRDYGPQINAQGRFSMPHNPEIFGLIGGDIDIEIPEEMSDIFVNRKSTWESGPPENEKIPDNCIGGVGWWTMGNKSDNAGATRGYVDESPSPLDSRGTKDNTSAFEMFTAKDRPKMLYHFGHASGSSKAMSHETSVIGWDGMLYANDLTLGDTEVGACQAYAMYSSALRLDDYRAMGEAGKEFIVRNYGFPRFEDPDRVVRPEYYDHWEQFFESLDLSPEEKVKKAHMLVGMVRTLFDRYEEPVSYDWALGACLKKWDFICKLSEPVHGNEYKYCPDKDQLLNSNPMSNYLWGEHNGNWRRRRFSYIISKDCQLFVMFLKMSANGVLWHVTSPNTPGLIGRESVLRVYNFTHIHALTPTSRPHDPISAKYNVIPQPYGENQPDRDPFKAKYREMRTTLVPGDEQGGL